MYCEMCVGIRDRNLWGGQERTWFPLGAEDLR